MFDIADIITNTIDEDTKVKGGKTYKEIVSARAEQANYSDSMPISFEELFGNLRDFSFLGEMDLRRLNLNSLKGIPRMVYGDYLKLSDNPALHSLDHFPKILKGDHFSLYIESCKLLELASFPVSSIEKISGISISDNQLDIADVVLMTYKNREFHGSFKPVSSDFEQHDLEKFYLIFKKLNYDFLKLKKILKIMPEPVMIPPF